MNHTNQSGRSMIEMLGVLAIIGVLSVGGIAGYSKAMMKFKINKTIDQISQIVANTRTLYARQKNYGNLSEKIVYKANLAPKEMFEGSGSDYAMTNAFGGEVHLATSGLYARGDKKAFILAMGEIPDEACIELITQDWGSDTSSGLVAVGSVNASPNAALGDSSYEIYKGCSGNSYYACPNGSSVSVPMSVDRAVELCDRNGYNTLVLKYY